MVLRPLRRTPMMLGGVGFQVGLDEARRAAARAASARAAPDLVEQLKRLQALHETGALTSEELQLAKRKVLAE